MYIIKNFYLLKIRKVEDINYIFTILTKFLKQITEKLEEISIFLLDGSEIDEEYFSTLKAQTTLIIQRPGEKIMTGLKN